jgi:DNA-binding transcriptional ArsR family regulator
MNRSARRREPRLPTELLDRMADVLKVLAHPQRLRILEILALQETAPVHAVMKAAGIAQAAASHHLNKMRRAGLIAAERKGKESWYRIQDPSACTILDCIRKKARTAD